MCLLCGQSLLPQHTQEQGLEAHVASHTQNALLTCVCWPSSVVNLKLAILSQEPGGKSDAGYPLFQCLAPLPELLSLAPVKQELIRFFL